ncbi:biotin transporter BioY [Metamycoplasma hyosynoviae]|uniref:aminopeptidase C n=1 Tax=Metamycoplasma hyosynoviae TaxID=29559 RepID=UPI0004620322|nr:C1 family peptidase [Metamycoplasma hyosynoviae]KDE42606.1 biotin transporter BioY [Metamycoplasma hyosynoviae]
MNNLINKDLLKSLRKTYLKDKSNKIIENSILKNGIASSSLNVDAVNKHDFEFSIETKVGQITNQKNSGRCWIFASLNMARLALMEKLNVENIELSQNYIGFYDYLEKANTYLNFMLEEGLKLDYTDRLFQRFNHDPVSDGGYYEWFIDLVKKYGILPKASMPETFQSTSTSFMFEQINLRLKAYVVQMRQIFEENKNQLTSEIYDLRDKALQDTYSILVKSLGLPPEEFTFSYRDKDKKYFTIKSTPKEFYEKYIAEVLENKITIISDPREIYPYYRLLHSKYVKSMYEGIGMQALNIPLEEQKQAIIASLKDNKAVWYGCDVTASSERKLGIMDENVYVTDLTLTKTLPFSKKQRFEMQASFISHAMNLVGVNIKEDGTITNWKVENSWGDDIGKKGIFSMSDKWFDEYSYEAIVDKKYLSEKALKGLEEPAIELDPFDLIV